MKYTTDIPIKIEAFQMTRASRTYNFNWPNWLHKAWNEEVGDKAAVWPEKYPLSDGTDNLIVGTPDRNERVEWGYFIIKDESGNLWVMKKPMFEAIYKLVVEKS